VTCRPTRQCGERTASRLAADRNPVVLTHEEEQMLDLAAMTAALNAMRSATDSLENAEARLQIAGVIEQLADAQLALRCL